MRIGINTTGIHHVALRSTDLPRSRRFYLDTLGFPLALEGPNAFLFLAGATAVEVRGPEALTPEDDVFSPFRTGLDHVALACEDERELDRVASALSRAGIDQTGIRTDAALDRRYVAFRDPDRIGWELYMAPNFAVGAVQAYFDGLRQSRVDRIPFAPGVVYQGPLGPELRGADAVRQFLRSTVAVIREVRVLQHLSQGAYVGTHFELDTIYGVIPGFDWFHVVNDQIFEVRRFYDPRPIVAQNGVSVREQL